MGALIIGGFHLSPVHASSGSGSSYVPLTPQRILDTRVTGNPVGSNGTLNLRVAGVGSVPADATAVAVNVTATDTTRSSDLEVYPAGTATPTVSNLNWTAGETVANLVIVPVGALGQVTLYNDLGTVDVVVDLEGYFVPETAGSTAGSYVPLTPARITDTRPGSGEPNSGTPLTPGDSLNVQVEGEGMVPSGGVGAVALNVTATDTTQYSDLTAFPTGISVPASSNLNWWPRDTVANRVIVPVGSSGQVSFYNLQGDADLVVDVVGYFTDGTGTPSSASLYYPIGPIRVLDTRLDAGTPGAGSYLSEQFAQIDGISSTADAVVANLTTTNASRPSFFSVVPEPTTPVTSDVNFTAAETVPNLVIATLNGQGDANIYNADGTADAIVDVFGYFEPITATGSGSVAPCTSASLTAAVTTSTQGTPVNVSTGSTCPGTASYQYWYQPSYGSAWLLAEDWTSADTYSYPTTDWAPGMYALTVWASTGDAYQSAAGTTRLTSDATVLVPNVTYTPQLEGMTCEEATLQMGLSHEGISVSQQQVLNAEGADESVPGIGPAYTRGDPMVNFVGYPNGGSSSGYEPGAYYGAIVRAADALGGDVLWAGEGLSPQGVYDWVDQGHPVEVWVTFNFHVEYATSWLTNGVHTWPWAGPDEHAVLIVGITNDAVEIDNPWAVATDGAEYYGQDQWVPMSTFESVYAVYDDMAVVLN